MIDCYEDTFFGYKLTRNDFSLILRGQKHLHNYCPLSSYYDETLQITKNAFESD